MLLYTSYNQTDFDYLAHLYNYGPYGVFFKRNLTLSAYPESKTWPVIIASLYANQGIVAIDRYIRVFWLTCGIFTCKKKYLSSFLDSKLCGPALCLILVVIRI